LNDIVTLGLEDIDDMAADPPGRPCYTIFPAICMIAPFRIIAVS
jgi:hypothetical protein